MLNITVTGTIISPLRINREEELVIHPHPSFAEFFLILALALLLGSNALADVFLILTALLFSRRIAPKLGERFY